MDRFILLLLIASVSAALASSRRLALRVLSLAPPAAIAVVYFFAWLDERHATDGDPEPGLIAAVGIAATSIVLVAALAGRLWRIRRDRPTKS